MTDMNDQVSEKIKEFKEMGIIFSFDGFAVADFVSQLDKVVDVKSVNFTESRLTIVIGEIKQIKTMDLLPLIPAAAMLNVANAFEQKQGENHELLFEWILPREYSKPKEVQTFSNTFDFRKNSYYP